MDDSALVSKYFADYLNKGFRRIFEEQRRIAVNKIYGKQGYRTDGTPRSRSGRLQAALDNPTFAMSGGGASLSAMISYPTYIRFLDMKRMGNLRIYNRPIWGILYKDTFVKMKYEFEDWLRSFVDRTLRDSFNP